MGLTPGPRRWAVGLLSLGAAMAAASARAGTPSCGAELFPLDLSGVAFAQVTAERLPVLHDPETCGRAQGLCPSKAYLVRGDRVIAAQTLDGFRCVAFVGPRGQTTGWVRPDALAPVDTPASGDWAGTWARRTGQSTLTIMARGGRYRVSAEAFGRGADPDNIRTGGAEGPLTVTGDRAKAVDTRTGEACVLQLRRLGPYILANDAASDDANSPCGGMGVTMNGIYLRR
jgi:hypothetical protein